MTSPLPQNERSQQRLAAGLALTAGYLDGYGLLMLGTYVSFMSGNTTMTGLRTGEAQFMAALGPALAIASFVAGSFVGTRVTQSRLRYSHRVLFGIIGVLLVVAFGTQGHPSFKDLSIAVLSCGMGMLNPALSKIGAEAVSLTFMTGTLSRIGSHLALAVRRAPLPDPEGPWDGHMYRARVDATVWAGFVSGAVLSGLFLSHSKKFVLLPAVAVMLLLAMFSRADQASDQARTSKA